MFGSDPLAWDPHLGSNQSLAAKGFRQGCLADDDGATDNTGTRYEAEFTIGFRAYDANWVAELIGDLLPDLDRPTSLGFKLDLLPDLDRPTSLVTSVTLLRVDQAYGL
ncbi:hypothetical protein ACLB2K_008282 [Fragaria x ananassa]